MNHTILIHGMPSKEEYLGEGGWPSPSNAHWIPWIQTQLSYKDLLSQAPEMPSPYEPNYEKWKEIFEQFKISDETILVGHSCGGGFLLRYFSENKQLSPKRMILVAPWIDPEPHELGEGNDFFGFEIDPNLTSRTDLHLIYSTDDEVPCTKSAEIIKNALPILATHEFSDKGHFTEPTLGTKAFPELLEVILK